MANHEFLPDAFASSEVDIYHADTGQMTTARLSVARDQIAEATLGDTAIFAGGRYFRRYGKSYPQSAVDLYDAQTGQWSTASLSVPRLNPKSRDDSNFVTRSSPSPENGDGPDSATSAASHNV